MAVLASWCSWGMRSMSREVTLSVFIISWQIFVLRGPRCQPKRGRTFIWVWVQTWWNMKKKTVKVLKERDDTLSSLLKYAVVLVYLKWWPVPWMQTVPDSHDDVQSPLLCWRWLDATGAPHSTWPQDICQRSGHIFWYSTECKWRWMSCGGGTWAPPLVRVWQCVFLDCWLWVCDGHRWFVGFWFVFVFVFCFLSLWQIYLLHLLLGKWRPRWLFVFVSMWKSVFTIKLIWYQITASLSAFFMSLTFAGFCIWSS